MKLRGACIVGLLAVAAIGAPSAHAAATRAEYVAQADAICQANRGPASVADDAVVANSKRWVRAAKTGTVKAFVRQTRRYAQSILAFTQIHTSVTEQIAAVPPPPADAATVVAWLNYRRQSDAFSTASASALNRFRFKQFYSQTRQADDAEAAGRRTAAQLGFQLCAVPGVYL